MAEKRVSVRLAAVGGRQVRAELEGIGAAGERGFGRLRREMAFANKRVERFYRTVRIGAAAAAAAIAGSAAAMVRSGLTLVDTQAKLAQSLSTSVASIQVLARAGDLAGVAMSGIEQATKDLTRRLSQAAAGTGPAVAGLQRLGLSAEALLALPLDARVGRINQAIEDFVPAAERAAVAGQLFGEEGAIAMSRIDSATLAQATTDVRAFGVAVSEQDADRIERTNDALSRLGLIWRGLSNQLAVAAAPALEAVADAMAAVASRTGPLGVAIQGLLGSVGRLTTYAATFTAFLAGRWVAGMAAAALSVRGLATALVVLRGALVRTGVGALVVAAGELVHQFGRLVRAAGGFGAALDLLGAMATEVWDRIGLLAGVAKARTIAAWRGLQASIAEALRDALVPVTAFGNRAVATVEGALDAVVAIWRRLPGTIADLTIQAANGVIAAVEAMVNAAVAAINGLIAGANAALSEIGLGAAMGLLATVDLGRIESRFAKAASRAGEAAQTAFAAAFEAQRLAPPDLGLSALAEEARAAAAAARATAAALTDLAGAPLASVAALGTAMAGLADATDAAGGAGRRADGAFIDLAGGAAASQGQAGGQAAVDAAAQASTGWARVRDEFAGYSDDAATWGEQIGRTLTGAFGRAEDALADFVTSGKLSFASLADAIVADLARIAIRQAITAPLAGALFGGVFHAGGVVGDDPSPQRPVAVAAFAGAPRLHAGGMAGLRPDEVPAILQRGEAVLTPGQMRLLGRGIAAADDRAPQVVVNFNAPVSNAAEVRQSAAQAAAGLARMVHAGRRGV
ncbi:phage tail tape-measure protein [Rhodothalassium salexigens]|uniref:phage tail tape measure C-terminal domain-containing protein n=1 Tax=Rhodothalassium salexigens TaxID=1086 RepID=UPI00191489E2|nr:phage tail tape measure C-terminal domain-containing protein [Rhodothalassium salexigens]MBK5911469.1 phage tail tape-measure protein [Rhodothalassium salexigens]